MQNPSETNRIYIQKKNIAMHIAVAGNIGSGKTTLTELLAKQYGWEAHFEDVDENPYLNDFYEDMQRWSFNLQIYFLKSRFSQIMDIRKSGKNIIQDRTIYEDAQIFAPNLFDMGLMTERDFSNYCKLFKLMSSMIQAPDLLIYLRSSVPTLVNNIQKRGREYEETIRLDYLKNLNNRYENWIKSYNRGKILIVDADNIDFLKNPNDLNAIMDQVEAQIHGLF
ncbi:deoxynucleoside kinase [Ancylomarina sp.]|uniref:deoxynucleoside kinase n=1 Tax=Ancylomarina sp. TaxID=1970196 RepID=UPI0035614ED5